MYRNDSISSAAQAVAHLYTTQFLKDQIDDLSSRDTCWHQSGVKGLVTLLLANVSQSPTLGVNVSQGLFRLSSSGNNFSIDLATYAFEVNGLTESTYHVLSGVHIFTMAVAFFLIYPIILLLDSMTVLCDLVRRPVEKHKVKKWETGLKSLVFIPLVITGFVTGILAMGSSDHFRTEHGIVGLATVVFAVVTDSVYFVELYFSATLRRTIRGIKWLQIMHYVDMAACQAILILSGFALSDGFDDLVVMGLCTVDLSMSLTFSLGMMVVFVWNGAVVAMTLQWFLVRRARLSEGDTTRMWRLVRLWRR
ncbi:hypothetical protein B0J13DRAFT_596707 [Dactylonectria estremocensis]|uniref:Cytochrome b561 domain-containing protein n=1 Tax=Dactylonectria estremocensis TaxID=1079267 RepID=A0A9P9J366_9HYPO|nr:hypothetical protein B0J13DRAFT_596707 [Dactylonectria estremocensis]